MDTPFLIRKIAEAILLVRRKSIARSSLRFIVFTGTSGKTLTRVAAAHALSGLGYEVVVPKAGYTNALGIVLASLGIEQIALRSFSGIKEILAKSAPKNAFALIELSADFRTDVHWFTKHFSPYAVVVTDVATEEWVLPYSEVLDEKIKLLKALPPEGIVVIGRENPSLQGLMDRLPPSVQDRVTIAATAGSSPNQFSAQQKAIALAEELVLAIFPKPLPENIWYGFAFPPDRLKLRENSEGIRIFSDTYKAIPLCTRYFLEEAAKIPSGKRVAVLSEMHPSPTRRKNIEREVAMWLAPFDAVYFVGSKEAFAKLRAEVKRAEYIHGPHEYQEIAEAIKKKLTRGDLIAVKGALRYQLEKLAAFI